MIVIVFDSGLDGRETNLQDILRKFSAGLCVTLKKGKMMSYRVGTSMRVLREKKKKKREIAFANSEFVDHTLLDRYYHTIATPHNLQQIPFNPLTHLQQLQQPFKHLLRQRPTIQRLFHLQLQPHHLLAQRL